MGEAVTQKKEAKEAKLPPNMAQCYKEAYDTEFTALPTSTKDRVLAVKADPTLVDSRVESFVQRVIVKAEARMHELEHPEAK